jgi:uncharacterized protein YoxC
VFFICLKGYLLSLSNFGLYEVIDLNKIEKKIVNWLIIFIILCIATACLIFIIWLIDQFVSGYKKDWDALAFTGSIIGGALTLIGVKWALDNQKKESFKNDYPKKILILDDLINMVKDMSKSFYNNASLRSERSQHELMEEVKTLIKLSSEINAEVYDYAKDIEDAIISHQNVLKTIGFLSYTDELYREKLSEEAKGRLWDLNKETNAEIRSIHEKFYEYRDKLSSNYNKLTKIN